MANVGDMKSLADGLLNYFPNKPKGPFAADQQSLEELSVDHRLVRRQRRRRRFLKAFVVAFFIWLAAHAIFRSTAFKSGCRGKYNHFKSKYIGEWFPVPQGIALEHCAPGDEWSEPVVSGDGLLTSENSFDLSLSSENLFVISQGQWSGGVLHVTTSPEQAQGTATVHVEVKYYKEHLRNLVKVCHINREGEEAGVVILTPKLPKGGWRWGRRRNGYMSFETTVVLPEVEAGSAPLRIKKFETDVLNTVQQIGDLNQKVVFDYLSLRGTDAPIVVRSLSATSGSIRTTNGPIAGVFNTTKSLIIETSNSPVGVDVGLESDKDGSQPSLIVRTSNSPLKAAISLTSVSETGGSFNVTATTSNSPLAVNFPASPVDSKLTLSAKTSNSPVGVFLNPAYEGALNLQTSSWFKAEVNVDKEVVDPSGKDRKRNVVVSGKQGDRGSLSGFVKWEGEEEEREVEGVVDVSTSNFFVVVNL